MNGRVVVSDYFWKESNKKRFFQLIEEDSGNYILYQKTEGDGKPRGRIPISAINRAEPYNDKPKERRFKFITENRTYYLKSATVEMMDRWIKAVMSSKQRDPIEQMRRAQLTRTAQTNTGGAGSSAAFGSKDAKSSTAAPREDLDTVSSMSEFLVTINNGMRFINEVLSQSDCFNKFALHMQGSSYFDIAVYAPIFAGVYKDFYSTQYTVDTVDVKLEKTSSVDLAKERFEKYLMLVEQAPLKSRLLAADLEARVSEAAKRVLATVAKYKVEAAKVQMTDINQGITLMDQFFRMLVV